MDQKAITLFEQLEMQTRGQIQLLTRQQQLCFSFGMNCSSCITFEPRHVCWQKHFIKCPQCGRHFFSEITCSCQAKMLEQVMMFQPPPKEPSGGGDSE